MVTSTVKGGGQRRQKQRDQRTRKRLQQADHSLLQLRARTS